MKKRVLSLLLVLVLALSTVLFVACGQKQVVSEDPINNESSQNETSSSEVESTAELVSSKDSLLKVYYDYTVNDYYSDGYYGNESYDNNFGYDNYKVTQVGNDISVTGLVQGYYNSSLDVTALSNGTSNFYDYHHWISLSIESRLKENRSYASISNIYFWVETLDEEGEGTGHFEYNDGDEEYKPANAYFGFNAGNNTYYLNINVDLNKTLKIKVLFSDEKETTEEFVIDCSQLKLSSTDDISDILLTYPMLVLNGSASDIYFKKYNSEDESWENAALFDSNLFGTNYIQTYQYGKEFYIDATEKNYHMIPYFDESSEFSAGHMVVFGLQAKHRIASDEKSICSVSGGDAKVYTNLDFEKLYETVYTDADEDWKSNEQLDNELFFIAWRVDPNNLAPITIKVKWADYAIEQEYTVSIMDNPYFESHTDNIFEVKTASELNSSYFYDRFCNTDRYITYGNVANAASMPAMMSYDSSMLAMPFNFFAAYQQSNDILINIPSNYLGTPIEGFCKYYDLSLCIGTELVFKYIGEDEIEIGPDFLVKEDGKVIYSYNSLTDSLDTEYVIYSGNDVDNTATFVNTNGGLSFSYFPKFKTFDEKHVVEITWGKDCSQTYTIRMSDSLDYNFNSPTYTSLDAYSLFFKVKCEGLNGGIDQVGKNFKSYLEANEKELDPEINVISEANNGDDCVVFMYDNIINIRKPFISYYEFENLPYENGYYYMIDFDNTNSGMMRNLPEEVSIMIDGEEVEFYYDTSYGYFFPLHIQSENEEFNVKIEFNNYSYPQEYVLKIEDAFLLSYED